MPSEWAMDNHYQKLAWDSRLRRRSQRSQRRSGLNTTETVPLPVTGLPFMVAGLNRHSFTASSADPRSTGEPSTAFTEITFPAVSTTIATWTVPAKFILRAKSG